MRVRLHALRLAGILGHVAIIQADNPGRRGLGGDDGGYLSRRSDDYTRRGTTHHRIPRYRCRLRERGHFILTAQYSSTFCLTAI